MADKQLHRFSNSIDKVEVSSLGAKVTMKPTDGDEIIVEYNNPRNSPEFCAVLSGTTLELKERFTFDIFGIKPADNYTLDVYLPKKTYSKIQINTAANGADIDDVKAETFELHTASGNININAYADFYKVQSASGNVTLTAPSLVKAKHILVRTVSGSANVSGIYADSFSLHSVSGSTNYNGASGSGEVCVTSGNVNIDYASWNDDIKISLISGIVNITLPQGAGMDVKFDGISGILKTDIGAPKGQFMKLGKGTAGQFGGENKHNVAINVTSGIVTIAQGDNEDANIPAAVCPTPAEETAPSEEKPAEQTGLNEDK